MKKLFLILMAMLTILTGCSKKEVESEPQITEEPEIQIVGGWSLNLDLPEINDAYFSKAIVDLVGVEYSPLLVLGEQSVAETNYAYLAYGKTVTANPETNFKIIFVHGDMENSEILTIADFNLTDYLDNQGSTTPEGLMGGWQDNNELPNLLDEKTNEVFDKALESLVGAGYKPIVLLGTQLVAGKNYAILASGTSVTAEPVSHLYVLNIYEDLQGNVNLNNICGINLAELAES